MGAKIQYTPPNWKIEGAKFYHLITYGCQMNDHDAQVLAGILENLGYQQTLSQNEADVILINTCCVRETAENKVWGLLGRLKALKVHKPDLIIGVCGCMPQQEVTAKKIKHNFPHVDLIFGTHNTHELPRMIKQLQEGQDRLLEVWSSEGSIVEDLPVKREPGVKAWVTIMYGCNNFCTYCIVPYVRGRERSRQPEEIIREVKLLVAQGYQEVTLLGQNVNSYGKDLGAGYRFADLLQEINNIDGLARIRYMTSHPRDFSDHLVEVIANCPKVCEHFHLPVQSGSNAILQRMNRGYTREKYLSLVEKIKNTIPQASISTDIIVGFPGEQEEDFLATLDIVQKVRYDNAFTFIYNLRSGTPAAKMADQVPAEVKSERIQRLIKLQNQITLANNRADEGKTMTVLVEGQSKNDPAKMAGRTGTNKLVVFSGENSLSGKLVTVKITSARLNYLIGDRI